MSAIIGILLDVSGSMRQNVGDVENGEERPWARSIFQVINDLIKHDLSPENKVFAHAFGADCEKEIFDILGTVKKFQNKGIVLCDVNVAATNENIEEVFHVLEENGARNIRKWAKVDVVRSSVQDYLISLVLSELKTNVPFRDNFVNNILPTVCRNWKEIPRPVDNCVRALLFTVISIKCPLLIPVMLYFNPSMNTFSNQSQQACATVGSQFKQATKKDVLDVVEKAKSELLESPNQNSVITVHEALKIVHGCIDKEELTIERSKELHKLVEPFIYGGTPLFRSLEKSRTLFKSIEFSEGMKKVLFVLSDGQPGDIDLSNQHALSKIKSEFFVQDITIVCCFITGENVCCPKKLYINKQSGWSGGAKFLFTLSSVVPIDLLPRVVLLKRGWDIDISKNETKLFMEVSHPENIREACDLAQTIVCSQEALSNLLVLVDLDIYIDQERRAFKVPHQEGGTCYANASATVLHLSMKRILGRDEGYPDFEYLRNELIKLHGTEGASTYVVLREVCPRYRLHCKRIKLQGALEAITEKRLVVAIFRLTDEEWNAFYAFYKNNKSGILTKRDIDISKRRPHENIIGHAVVLTSFSSQCLRLMNSWGHTFGDNGFFRVKSSDVLNMTFIDVYWTLDDLSEQEKAFFATHGSRVSQKLMESLVGLQKQTYTCPLCGQTSPVTTYTGTLNCATCPRCRGEFSCNGAGNILALNVYLTSLTR